MAETLDEGTIATRVQSYNMAYMSAARRRQLAIDLVTPGSTIPEYDGMLEVRYQLSLLWALGHKTVMRAAGHLWRVPPLISEYAGQQAIVFQHGDRDTAANLRNGEDYLRMTIGVLPPEPPVSHAISGRRSLTATLLEHEVRPPLAYGVATLPLLNSRLLSIDYGSYDLSQGVASEPVNVPFYEATTHIGEDAEHSRATAQIILYHILAGDTAVEAYLANLATQVSPHTAPNLRADLGLSVAA